PKQTAGNRSTDADVSRHQHQTSRYRQEENYDQRNRERQLQLDQVVCESSSTVCQTRLPPVGGAEPRKQVNGKREDVQLRETHKDHAIHWTTPGDYGEQKRQRHSHV